MNNFIDLSCLIPFDFYDELLVKYYGKLHEYIDVDLQAGVKVKVTSYIWNDKIYVSKVEVTE